MRGESLCILWDCTLEHFSDEEGFLPPVPGGISSVPELVDYLRFAATRGPHIVGMDLPGQLRAWIAIGGPWGAVELVHVFFGQQVPADHPPSWRALPDQPVPVEYVGFLTEG